MERASIDVRRATPEDAPAMAAVRVRTWRDAYRDIIPAPVLSALSVEENAEGFRDAIASETLDHRFLVGTIEKRVLGFAVWLPAPYEDGETGELLALYVDPEVQQAGLGRRLLSRAALDMHAEGYRRMIVFVLEANRAGQAFYERTGGRLTDRRRTYRDEDLKLPEIGYRYDLPLVDAVDAPH